MWLTDLWLKRLSGEFVDSDWNLLRMSYWSGPNEAWIAVRRNRLALDIFPKLPDELAEEALSEFVGLVRSGLYADASSILAGPGWAVHEQLLSRLTRVDEVNRHEFARAAGVKGYRRRDGSRRRSTGLSPILTIVGNVPRSFNWGPELTGAFRSAASVKAVGSGDREVRPAAWRQVVALDWEP